MRCKICDADHATYDYTDNDWYCVDCFEAIEEAMWDFPIEGEDDGPYEYEVDDGAD